MTAHLDHPAFVALGEVREGRLGELGFELEGDGSPGSLPKTVADRSGRFLLCEFRGGVHRPYFDGAGVEFFAEGSTRGVPGTIVATGESMSPYRRMIVAFEGRAADRLAAGDIGRWRFDGPAAGRLPRVEDGLLFTHACDDLAAVAAALAMLDRTHRRRALRHVGVLLTRAEEVGFIGAIAAARSREIPKATRLLCLENSRSFAESPIGGGPIVRVGDRLSVFSPDLTNAVSSAATAHAKAETEAGRTFPWQRKLMAGGACEATAFASYGRPSTCLCLPLGHYHNMSRIDEVVAGERPAKVAPEFISVEDYHGLVDLLEAVVERLDESDPGSGRALMERLHRERKGVLLEGCGRVTSARR